MHTYRHQDQKYQIPMPFSPKVAAAANWVPVPQKVAACLSCTVRDVVPPPQVSHPISQARANNYGGLNDMSLGPYYDPRTIASRAPIEACADGGVVSAPSLRHGPAAFFPEPAGTPAREKTQFAPRGVIDIDPYPLPLYRGPCACWSALCPVQAYSVMAALLTPRNIRVIRRRLQATGIVTVSKELKAFTRGDAGCGCRILGGPEEYGQFVVFASRFEDTCLAQLLDPARTISDLDDEYVQQVLTSIQGGVLGKARMNYVRAEGCRAYLDPRPEYVDDREDVGDGFEACEYVLPGTGIVVTPADTLFASRALTDPRSSAANRAALGCQTGLGIGTRPQAQTRQMPCPTTGCWSPASSGNAFAL